MPSGDGNVLRVNAAEEESDFRDAVCEIIGKVLAEKRGRTLIDIAEAIDVSVKTVSNAFNKTHSLSETFLRRIGRAFGADKLDPWAALFAARFTLIETDPSLDALPSMTGAVHRLAVARSPDSPGGDRITHTELLEIEPEIDAAIRALAALKERCREVRAA